MTVNVVITTQLNYYNNCYAYCSVPTALLQDGGKAKRIHPLHHELSRVSREVVSAHVCVLGLESELAVHTVLCRAW
jgi:hypothetical protein